jgi:hypothetical protein
MQFIAFNSHVVLWPTVRTKIKRRLREAVRLIVTCGVAVEESHDGVPKLVFRAEDVSADKWIVPGASVLSIITSPSYCRAFHSILAKTRGAVFPTYSTMVGMPCVCSTTLWAPLQERTSRPAHWRRAWWSSCSATMTYLRCLDV